MKTIEIIVASDGTTLVETKGFAGDSCREASRFLEEALGRKASDRLTAEFYTSTAQTQSQQNRA